MGPLKAAQKFLAASPGATSRRVTLYGSLAATGKGHLTDKAILDTLTPVAPCEIVWMPETFLPFHPNGMKFEALDPDGNVTAEETYYSIGGGDILKEGESRQKADSVYEMSTIRDIQKWCEKTGSSFWEYVDRCEGQAIWDYLHEVWTVMKQAVERGIEARCAPRRAGRAPQGRELSCACRGLCKFAQKPRSRLCLCPGRERGERLGRQDCHSSHLRLLRHSAGGALSSAQI